MRRIPTFRIMNLLRIAALVVAFGLFSATPVFAQEDAATEVADTASQVVAEEEDDGFDWGLLGLLGLLGLAGLLKKNDNTHTTTRVDRSVEPGIDTTRR